MLAVLPLGLRQAEKASSSDKVAYVGTADSGCSANMYQVTQWKLDPGFANAANSSPILQKEFFVWQSRQHGRSAAWKHAVCFQTEGSPGVHCLRD
jgi:hypothetical protein